MENKNITAKLVKILATMAGVPKKGYNSHQKYHYMREVDILETLKAELIKNNLILLTSSKLIETKQLDKGFLSMVETAHIFVDSDSGEQLTISSVGSGWDSTDKSVPKAITSSTKYALLKTFMISDEGADVENDGETKQEPAIKIESPKSFSKPTVKPEPTQDRDVAAPKTLTFSTSSNKSTFTVPKVENKFKKKAEPDFKE